MEWNILNNFTVYAPILPMKMELDKICYTLNAKNNVSLPLYLERKSSNRMSGNTAFTVFLRESFYMCEKN